VVFTKRLREGVRLGRIKCSVRIWTHPHVKAGGRYPMDDGSIVVDSIEPIRLGAVTNDLARESGFSNRKDLLQTAKHGRGKNVYLIRFRYLPPGAWDTRSRDEGAEHRRDQPAARSSTRARAQLLQRINRATPRTKR
jgi:hypothetical protein